MRGEVMEEGIDIERGTQRVNGILHGETDNLTQKPARKTRSDKGTTRADSDEIVLRFPVYSAQKIAMLCAESDQGLHFAAMIQDQIIAHLQKKLDSLRKI